MGIQIVLLEWLHDLFPHTTVCQKLDFFAIIPDTHKYPTKTSGHAGLVEMRGAMPSIQITSSHISANELFKAQYQRVLKWSLLAAMVLIALGVWLVPAYHPKPYVLRDQFFQLEDFEIIEDIQLPDKPMIKPPVIVREIEPVTGDLADEYNLPDNIEWDYFPEVSTPEWDDPLKKFSPASSNPILMHFAKPDYPEIARRSRLQGLVIIKVLVGKDGQVEKTVILQGVNPILNKAAAEAARKCRFKPGTQRTIPVKAWMAIPYSFKLN